MGFNIWLNNINLIAKYISFNSLRYLQFESRAISTLPSLDSGPIPRTPPWPAISKFLRSSSVDVLTIDDVDEEDAGGAANIGVALHGKLPALLQPPLLAGSYDNCMMNAK